MFIIKKGEIICRNVIDTAVSSISSIQACRFGYQYDLRDIDICQYFIIWCILAGLTAENEEILPRSQFEKWGHDTFPASCSFAVCSKELMLSYSI